MITDFKCGVFHAFRDEKQDIFFPVFLRKNRIVEVLLGPESPFIDYQSKQARLEIQPAVWIFGQVRKSHMNPENVRFGGSG